MKERIKKYSGQEETKVQEILSASNGETKGEEQDETDASQLTIQSNKGVEIDVDTSEHSIQEIETIIIFDLCALVEIATSKSAVLGVSDLFEQIDSHASYILCNWKT